MANQIDRKSKLELRLEREQRQTDIARVRNEKQAKATQERQRRTTARTQNGLLKELLSEFRKECPVEIVGGEATFTFKGAEYGIRFGNWTIGGETGDVDDYKTEHKGWCLYTESPTFLRLNSSLHHPNSNQRPSSSPVRLSPFYGELTGIPRISV